MTDALCVPGLDPCPADDVAASGSDYLPVKTTHAHLAALPPHGRRRASSAIALVLDPNWLDTRGTNVDCDPLGPSTLLMRSMPISPSGMRVAPCTPNVSTSKRCRWGLASAAIVSIH